MFLSLPFLLVLVSVFEPIQLFFNHGHIIYLVFTISSFLLLELV